MNKIQILLFYYERPKFILNALNSIKKQNYKNWEVHFIDDGSIESPGKPIVENIFNSQELAKTFFYNTNDSKEQKIKRGGSVFGKYANEAMNNSNCDISIMLCDDDAIYPNYLENLNNFYNLNNNINYAYSHVCVFDPFSESIETAPFRQHWLNNHIAPINPVDRVDASQVSWRRDIIVRNNILFPFPKTYCLDADIYGLMFNKLGPCHFTGFISQYKAIHFDQLGNKIRTIKMYETVQ